ncbi:L-aspartate oxidase [Fusibacter sp. 3D3]|uniref:L-aspartate oxidase n=1 Tax=Fusibacter sp. 3D3 TaxID=1048380 RepID=UPI0008531EC6|nr:FAD-dependent oxidoreductase [Fusibacter sp. 3D3]GAU75690.1 L-aspartate oxidase [Fusibacter sp. 3D3]
MKSYETDVVIIGAGIAGLYTALMLPKEMKIWIVSKADSQNTNSYLAQGGIAASMIKTYDSPSMHYEDTLKSGHYTNDPASVKVLVEEAEINMHRLEILGVHFDRDSNGQYLMGMEGAHRVARILRIGDHTGKSIMEVLVEQVKASENIRWETPFFGAELMTDGEMCFGVRGYLNQHYTEILSKWTVLATGGIGHLYSFTSNANGIDGSGIAMAIRAGVKTAHMHLTQFHPTVFYTPELEGRQFLISEAVRGEGAILRNASLERFMVKYDERLELSPRDVVSSAIERELALQSVPFVYLDVTHLTKSFLMERFPTIYAFCKTQGILMEKDWIPVAPRLHYFMGGVQTDLLGQTSMGALFAVGECAHTGVHGRNRLASNSLLEAVVFGWRVAKAIEQKALKGEGVINRPLDQGTKIPKFDLDQETLRGWMDMYMGINRDKAALEALCDRVSAIIENTKTVSSETVEATTIKESSIEDISLYNALVMMRAMICDAIKEFE